MQKVKQYPTMSECEWLDMFADNLDDILRSLDMSQKDLAEASGISEAAISYYMNKRKMPGVKAIINISNALNISIDALIDFDCNIV